MPTCERRLQAGTRRGVRLLRELGDEAREARLAAGRIDRLIVLVSATNANRLALRTAEPILRQTYPLAGRRLLAALSAGLDPGANGVLFL